MLHGRRNSSWSGGFAVTDAALRPALATATSAAILRSAPPYDADVKIPKQLRPGRPRGPPHALARVNSFFNCSVASLTVYADISEPSRRL